MAFYDLPNAFVLFDDVAIDASSEQLGLAMFCGKERQIGCRADDPVSDVKEDVGNVMPAHIRLCRFGIAVERHDVLSTLKRTNNVTTCNLHAHDGIVRETGFQVIEEALVIVIGHASE